jgi:hypothetical protein
MTTIAEVAAWPTRRVLDARLAGAAVQSFLDDYDAGAANAWEADRMSPEARESIEARVEAQELLGEALSASDDEHDRLSLVRICFDGAPILLLRLRDTGTDWDESRTATYGLTLVDGARADRLCDAIREASRSRVLEEAAAGEEADALLDFGPTLRIDEERGLLVPKRSRTLLSVTTSDYVMARLCMFEDNTYGLWRITDDVIRRVGSPSEALADLLKELDRAADFIGKGASRMSSVHTGSGREMLLLETAARSRPELARFKHVVCDEVAEEVSGTQAIGRFREAARDCVHRALAVRADEPSATMPTP